MPPTVYWDQVDQQISEIDPTYSSTAEWAVLRENAQSDLNHNKDEKESAPVATTGSDQLDNESAKKARADTTTELLEEYRQAISAQTEDIIPDCPKFRILLLGKTGVGKSTLSSRVLGIPYKVPTLLK